MRDMEVKATFQGMDQLKAAFKALGEAAAEDALRQAGMAGALPIQNAAKDNAPKKTRTLSRSIHSEVTEVTSDSVTVEIGTDVIYAAIQEFGGTIHQENAWGKGIVQDITIPAQPYLRPALAEHTQDAVDAAGAVLKQKIEGVGK